MSNGGHYEPITESNNTVLVGTNLHLQVSGSGKNYRWDIPGDTFKSYSIVWNHWNFPTSGTVVPVKDIDLLDRKVDFAWSKEVPSLTVNCTVEYGGRSVLVSATFHVLTPAAVLLPTWKDKNYKNGVNTSFGTDRLLTWTGRVTTPADLVKPNDIGRWNYVQLITPKRLQIKPDGTEVIGRIVFPEPAAHDPKIDDLVLDGKSTVLDTVYPYDPLDSSNYSWPANRFPQDDEDGIGSSIRAEEGFVGVKTDETLQLYLMYKAPGDSQWVSLRRFVWFWKAKASLSADRKRAVIDPAETSFGPDPGESEGYTNQPQWKSVFFGGSIIYK